VTWKRLLEQGRVERHATSAREVQDLRAVVERDLRDAALPGLSEDNAFGLAYEAGLLIARMATACAGYRVRGPGAHQATFVALEIALGSPASGAAAYFEVCRRKRNILSYDNADVASATEVTEILREARGLEVLVEGWIARRHPALAR
jgi:hypothetical protein